MANEGNNGVLPRIRLLEVDVTDDHINWHYYADWPGDATSHGTATLARTERRRKTIDLLVKVLEHHSDRNREDRLSADVYRELLSVVGQQLFELLFADIRLRSNVATALEGVRDATDEVDYLRVKLAFAGEPEHVGWLASLPWEYLHTPAAEPEFEHVFLAKRAELMLSRRLPYGKLRPLGDRRPLTVLLVSPNPIELLSDDDNDDERYCRVDHRRVLEKLEQLDREGIINLRTLVDDPPDYPVENQQWVTVGRLRQEIRKHPSPVIVHFIGHGRRHDTNGQLLFSREDGTRHWVGADLFCERLDRSTLKLVFLQACDSNLPAPYVPLSSVAMRVAQKGVPAVVAMQYRIKAQLANEFTVAFYDALLLHNSPIDVAVEAGREKIDEGIDERDRLAFGLPVVYLSSHNGMFESDRRTTEETLNRGDVPGQKPCARCGRQVSHEAVACPRCKLQLRCRVCADRRPFPDPEGDQLCEICGTEVHQPAWARDHLATQDSDARNDAKAAVLSVLDAPSAEEQ